MHPIILSQKDYEKFFGKLSAKERSSDSKLLYRYVSNDDGLAKTIYALTIYLRKRE